MLISTTHIPQTRHPQLFAILSAISLAITFPYLIGTGIPETGEYLIFAFFVLITGIPHGAVDHIVAAQVFGLRASFGDQARFYGSYLLTMLLFAGLWILSPIAGFLLFLVISVYHFGQGDLNWLNLPRTPALIAYLSRGIMLLALPILGHAEITTPIIREVSGFTLSDSMLLNNHASAIAVGSWFIHLLVLFTVMITYHKRVFWREVVLVVVLGITLLYTHPLVGFGIYFGLWHGLNHFFELRDHLYTNRPGGKGSPADLSILGDASVQIDSSNQSDVSNQSVQSDGELSSVSDGTFSTLLPIYKKTMPFTAMSLVGLILLWYILGGFGIQERMISVLFILISVLTLPHMVIIHQLYRISPNKR
jgi:Brp/Blh family beta-carotene 15,15'-monooxygenase